jgi:hypothetical protein
MLDCLTTRQIAECASVFGQFKDLGIGGIAVAGVTTASPTAITYGEVAEMYGALEAAYIPSVSWVMTSPNCPAISRTSAAVGFLSLREAIYLETSLIRIAAGDRLSCSCCE